jgi:hypothetical protein
MQGAPARVFCNPCGGSHVLALLQLTVDMSCASIRLFSVPCPCSVLLTGTFASWSCGRRTQVGREWRGGVAV